LKVSEVSHSLVSNGLINFNVISNKIFGFSSGHVAGNSVETLIAIARAERKAFSLVIAGCFIFIALSE
jgi:hypothetical protein